MVMLLGRLAFQHAQKAASACSGVSVIAKRVSSLVSSNSDRLGDGDQRAEPGRVDISGLGEIDEEFSLAVVDRFLDHALELLPIANDELAFDPDDENASGILLGGEAHHASMGGN
jgi:hypothetical protein